MDIVTWLYNLYESVPTPLQWVGNFFFSVIIVRGIIANEIMKEIREHRMWHYLVKRWNIYWNEPRNAAIHDHYMLGHTSPLEQCHIDMCNSLESYN